MNRIVFLVFLLITVSVSLFAHSSVWKISDGDKTLYIGGTIHILHKSDYPLPKEFDKAYKQSSFVVFEADVDSLKNPKYSAMFMSKALLPPERSLSSILSKDTDLKLKKYLMQENLPPKAFEHFQPWATVTILTQTQLGKMGVSESGVDAHYADLARVDGKKSLFLESPDEQMELISHMCDGEEDIMISQTIDDLEKLPTLINDMLLAWKNGDNQKLEQDLLSPIKYNLPKMYVDLVKNRNDKWMIALKKMMSKKQKGFVLVGVLHLVGDDGLLKQFERLGYRVEQVE
jgi:uncharacterized protein